MTHRSFISFILILCATVAMAAGKKFTLVIDPGHGGHDVGAMGKFSKEKDINLRTALAFGKYVERNCRDVKVIYTRKTDVFVTLRGRAEIANKAKADLFISIHTNSLPGKKISRGLETYTLGMHRAADNLDVAKRENSVILVEKDYKKHYGGFDPNSSESYIIFEYLQDNNMSKSVELAKLVQTNVCSIAKRPNKGVKQAGFLVLRETSMPSCLIELGFISTSDEEKLLNNEASVDEMARGIYQAFVKYKNNYSSGSSSSTKAPVQIEEPQQQEPEMEIREVVDMRQQVPNLDINQLQVAVPQVNEAINRNQEPAQAPQRNVVRQQPQPSAPQNQAVAQVARPASTAQNQANAQVAKPANETINQLAKQANEVQSQVARQNGAQNQAQRPNQSQVQNQPLNQVQRANQNPQVRKDPEPQQPKVQTLPQVEQPRPAQQPKAQTLPQVEQPRPAQQPKVQTLPQVEQPMPAQQPKVQTLPQVEQPKPAQQPKTQTLPQVEQPKPAQQPKAQPVQTPKAKKTPVNAPVGAPIFMLQIFVADKVLDPNDSRFKGEKNASYYKEGRIYKYTLGASPDYNEIVQLRNDMAQKFPGCFVVAFRNGEKINTNDAVIEFKVNQKSAEKWK